MRVATVVILAVVLSPTVVAENNPTLPVRRLNAALIEAMRRADSLGIKGRYALLAPVISRVFHFPIMARIAIGRHWRKLNIDQRNRIVDIFSLLSIWTFAARFNSYSGERFEVMGQRPSLRGSVLVKNRIFKSTGDSVAINYLLRKFDGEFRIVDVLLEAKFSELAIKRSQYTSIIKREGFDSLLLKLENKIAKIKGESGVIRKK